MTEVYRVSALEALDSLDYLFNIEELEILNEDVRTTLIKSQLSGKQDRLTNDYIKSDVNFQYEENRYYNASFYTKGFTVTDSLIKKQWELYKNYLIGHQSHYAKIEKYVKSKNFYKSFDKMTESIVSHIARVDDILGEDNNTFGMHFRFNYNHSLNSKVSCYIENFRNSNYASEKYLHELTLDDLTIQMLGTGFVRIEFKAKMNGTSSENVLEKIKPILDIYIQKAQSVPTLYAEKLRILEEGFDYSRVKQYYLEG